MCRQTEIYQKNQKTALHFESTTDNSCIAEGRSSH